MPATDARTRAKSASTRTLAIASVAWARKPPPPLAGGPKAAPNRSTSTATATIPTAACFIIPLLRGRGAPLPAPLMPYNAGERDRVNGGQQKIQQGAPGEGA